MQKPLIIYHSPCPDGFGAAYAAWRRFGDAADYLPADHNNYPELDVSGRDVFILDFSFPRERMVAMQAAARSMVVLDHHKTAIERFMGLPGVTLNLHKSGARLAWEYFHPAEPVPYLIRAVEDRDLFVWQMEGSADFLSYLDTVEFNFEAWDKLARLADAEMEVFRSKGASMRDWAGSAPNRGGPLMVSRRGQLASIDLFDTSSNYNFVVIAQSGSGKSFFSNELVQGGEHGC